MPTIEPRRGSRPAAGRGARLEFPRGASRGTVYLWPKSMAFPDDLPGGPGHHNAGATVDARCRERGWAELGPARGQVRIPPDHWALYAATPGAALDLSFLDDLGPAPLDGLCLANTAVKSRQLRHLEGLKTLRWFNAENAGAGLGDAGIAHLQALPGLEAVDVHATKVGDRGLEILGGAHRLQSLSLWMCKKYSGGKPVLTDGGMESLAKLRKLRYLNLGRTAVGDAGVASLAGMGLRGLFFDANPLTDRAAAAIAGMPGLRRLSFCMCRGITNKALEAIAGLKALEWLSLTGTAVGGQGLRLLPAPGKLKRLFVGGLRLDAGEIEAFRRSHPKCAIFA